MPSRLRSSPKSSEAQVEFPLQLTGIRIHEVVAQRAREDEPLPKRLPLSIKLVVPTDREEDTARIVLVVFETAAPDREGRACRIHLTLEARFEQAPGSTPLSTRDMADFEAQHAVVLVWPYLRQYLFDLTTKLDLVVPPLPVVDPRALVASIAKSAGVPRKRRRRSPATLTGKSSRRAPK